MTNDGPIVEDDLQAYVDGRLGDARRTAVEAYLAQNPDVRERVALDIRQRNALRGQLEGKFFNEDSTRPTVERALSTFM